MKKDIAILVQADENGEIASLCGDFNVKLGPAETEVTINDIPVILGEIGHIKLHKVTCTTCNKIFWVREKNNVKACPSCCSGALEIAVIEEEDKGYNETIKRHDDHEEAISELEG